MKTMLDKRTVFVRFRLNTNCRNTKSISREITQITGFDKNGLLIKAEGPPVTFYQWLDKGDEQNQLEKLLDRLAVDKITPEQITILAPVRRENSVVKNLHIQPNNYTPSKNGCITFSTIQAFKGLENSVIILTDINSYDKDSLMYVALSRARSVLFVFESEVAHKERLKKQQNS
jgi:superfamily I DNA/RNA helicase